MLGVKYMTKRILPPKDSVEAKKILDEVKKGNVDIWKKLGFACKASFLTCLNQRYGFYISKMRNSFPDIETKPVKPHIDIKIPKLLKYEPKKAGRGDPETQVLVIGDGHAGEITPTFNPDVYKKRMDKLFESTMRITHLHRNMYPLNNLVIIDVGDNVQGENPHQGSNIGQTAMGAVEQIYSLALPTMIKMLCSFKQEFKTVTMYGVRGNHGRYSRTAPKTSNWDLALYEALSNADLPSGVRVKTSKDFCQIVNIEGFRFFIAHFDQIRAYNGIPYFALSRKIQSWYASYGGFSYAIGGHFHKEDCLRINSRVKALINGSLVTDDPYALEIIGTSSIPSQWTFGVHRRHGLTWMYPLILDENFLPEKQNNNK